jgi:hypothetical protein
MVGIIDLILYTRPEGLSVSSLHVAIYVFLGPPVPFVEDNRG